MQPLVDLSACRSSFRRTRCADVVANVVVVVGSFGSGSTTSTTSINININRSSSWPPAEVQLVAAEREKRKFIGKGQLSLEQFAFALLVAHLLPLLDGRALT